MASITQLRDRWLARVRKHGRSASKVFDEEAAARDWARAYEAEGSALKALEPLKSTDWRAVTPEDLPRHRHSTFIGVYFLYLRGELVYVGQSVNVVRRVADHFVRVEFDEWSWTPVAMGSLREAEVFFIRKYRPRYNLTHNGVATELLPMVPEPA